MANKKIENEDLRRVPQLISLERQEIDKLKKYSADNRLSISKTVSLALSKLIKN